MRYFSVAIGLTVGVAAATNCSGDAPTFVSDSYYQAPARWNNFRRPATPTETRPQSSGQMPFGATVQSVAAQNQIETLPVPAPELLSPPDVQVVPQSPAPQPTIQSQPPIHSHHAPMVAPVHVHPQPVEGCAQCAPQADCSPYAAAAAAPWEGGSCSTCAPAVASGPYPIAPYFGGASLLFWDIAGGNDTPMIAYDNGVVVGREGDLNPSSNVGFDVHFGRYFACGQYALDFGYLYWNGDAYSRIFSDGGSGLRYINPALNAVSINRGGGPVLVYDEYDVNATNIRVTRDLRIQGFEANLTGFGLMGARRLGSCSPAPICGGALSRYTHPGCGYYGGATGPLARAACGNLRIMTSHGFRWFQLEDELEIAANVDGTGGYQATDVYMTSETENNLFGYQFGSQLTYCMGCRMMINIGGKIGVYGNDAYFSHRIFSAAGMAYTNSEGAGFGDICTDYSDVSLAGLGELDLGLGYRLSNRWTINGGYRILAACGVATAVGQIPTQYSTAASAGAVRADDCLMLHGAYVGFDYNW